MVKIAVKLNMKKEHFYIEHLCPKNAHGAGLIHIQKYRGYPFRGMKRSCQCANTALEAKSLPPL
jgi:hypothetical protein